jgi:adenylate cyclase class IV
VCGAKAEEALNVVLTLEPQRNIELKARDPDPQRSLALCGSLGAEDRGMLVQRDTYFHARAGRLKLREEDGAPTRLIAYERADLAGERTSHYRLIDVADPEGLKAALEATLGIKVVVAKERRLFLCEVDLVHLVGRHPGVDLFEVVADVGGGLGSEA